MAKDNTMKIITHVLGYFTTWIGPLIILLVSDEEGVKQHAKKALNWQISLMIYMAISIVLLIVLIGFLLIWAVSLMNIIVCIIASVKASKDELWDYPVAIKFLK